MNTPLFEDEHWVDFLFITNDRFDDIDSYYSLEKRPMTPAEIESDLELRRYQSTKALAIIHSTGFSLDHLLNLECLLLRPYSSF